MTNDSMERIRPIEVLRASAPIDYNDQGAVNDILSFEFYLLGNLRKSKELVGGTKKIEHKPLSKKMKHRENKRTRWAR